MKIYGIAENCYVNGRYDDVYGIDAQNTDVEPVVLIQHGLFQDKIKAEKKAQELNADHKEHETIKGFEGTPFVVVEIDINK